MKPCIWIPVNVLKTILVCQQIYLNIASIFKIANCPLLWQSHYRISSVTTGWIVMKLVWDFARSFCLTMVLVCWQNLIWPHFIAGVRKIERCRCQIRRSQCSQSYVLWKSVLPTVEIWYVVAPVIGIQQSLKWDVCTGMTQMSFCIYAVLSVFLQVVVDRKFLPADSTDW